jgi:hypothetical protein
VKNPDVKYKIVKALEVDFGYERRLYKTPSNAADLVAGEIVGRMNDRFDSSHPVDRDLANICQYTSYWDEDNQNRMFRKAKRRLLPIMKRLLA